MEGDGEERVLGLEEKLQAVSQSAAGLGGEGRVPSAAIKTRIPIPPAGAQSAAALNGTAERLTVRQSDVTEALAALRAEGSQFGLIVVAGAPPSNSQGGGRSGDGGWLRGGISSIPLSDIGEMREQKVS